MYTGYWSRSARMTAVVAPASIGSTVVSIEYGDIRPTATSRFRDDVDDPCARTPPRFALHRDDARADRQVRQTALPKDVSSNS
jgi:hypothetical protein